VKKSIKFAILVSSLLVPANAVFAAEGLGEVVVIATKTPTKLEQIANSVSVITEEDIEKSNAHDVAELLRSVPGIDVIQNGGVGKTTTVFLRGAQSQHTLVLIDGLEVNDPSSTANIFDFAHLNTDNIERIEILRGSGGTLYGSSAIGGVINIITKQGKGKVSSDLSLEYGSYNTKKAKASVSGKVDRLGFSASASRTDIGGFSAFNKDRGGIEDDGYDNATFSTRLNYEINDLVTADLNIRYTDAKTDFDNPSSDSTINNSNSDQINVGGKISAALLDGRWNQDIGVGYLKLDRDSTSSFGTTVFDGRRLKFDWRNDFQLDEHNLILAGIETERSEFKSSSGSDSSVRNNALYLQDQFSYKDFHVSFGGRVDDHEKFGAHYTYRISPTYLFKNTATKVKASYGTGFKAPSLFQLFSSAFGDVNLQPERSEGFDIGFEQGFQNNKYNFAASYFYIEIEDAIDFVDTSPPTDPLDDFPIATFSYQNVDTIRSNGFEVFADAKLTDKLTLSGDYTYTQSEDKATDIEQIRIAKHKVVGRADYNFLDNKANLNGNAKYVSGRRAFGSTDLDAYLVVNAGGNYQLRDNVNLFVRVENLFNEDYEEASGFGTPGLSGYLGVKFSL